MISQDYGSDGSTSEFAITAAFRGISLLTAQSVCVGSISTKRNLTKTVSAFLLDLGWWVSQSTRVWSEIIMESITRATA